MKLAACCTVLLSCVALLSGVAYADSSSSGSGGAAFESPLVVPAAQPLLEGQGFVAEDEAQRSTPAAVLAREESETRYESLSGSAAVRIAGEKFPVQVDESAGGVPKLPVGAAVGGFPTLDSAQIDFGNGQHGVIESTEPLAVEDTQGRRVPVSLGLRDAGNVFEPVAPVTEVQIPKLLSGGVRLAESGVTLTPVSLEGSPLRGAEGVVEGASVVYANVQTDTDAVVKPTTLGFDAATMLRSVDSPRQLVYRVGMPSGATLTASSSTPGSMLVVDKGTILATVHQPYAMDATGRAVPVSMTASGDLLTITVDAVAGEVEYPIYVDPTVTDKELLYNPGNWLFLTDNKAVFQGFKVSEGLEDTDFEEPSDENYYSGQYGFFSYTTQGASRIYAFVASAREEWTETGQGKLDHIYDEFQLRHANGEVETGNGEGGKAEFKYHESGVHERSGVTVCAESSCAPVSVSGSEQNAAYFEQKVTEEEKGRFRYLLKGASVEINQEKAPTASFDTSDATVEGYPNVLYAGKWYKPTANALFAIDAADPGIGINKEGLSSPSKAGWGYSVKNESKNGCEGVQCNECYEAPCAGKKSGTGLPITYSLVSAAGGELPEGEDTVEGKVEDAIGLAATATGKIKIDGSPPHGLTFSGLPSNHEIDDGQHDLLKASATDGTEGKHSSGIASIVLQLDGQSIGGGQGYCSPGPCTGNAEWTLAAENYAAGQHTLTLVATDNAGNAVTEEFQVTFHHPENVAVGPGGVNPVTGEVSLSASDVAISTPDGGLSVGRSYRSRHLAQGTEGPLGPQWSLNLGAQQSLARIPGGMVLTASSGSQVTFTSKGSGEFTSPAGDAGLVLLEKTEGGKTIFTLSDNGSLTTFELPTGSSGSVWMPSSAEGPNGTNTTLYKFKIENSVIEPTEELAPVAANVTCGKELSELKEGCHALKFEYATTTKAGENPSEWNEFAGHLARVKYLSWNTSKTKTEPVVAEYAYDKQGRLRAVWNPEVKPTPLKTTYGYDSEGHVTAVSAPGREPWLLEQGTIAGDASPGRLLATAVPSAATTLGSTEAPVYKKELTLSSTTPKVGVKISVNLIGTEKTPGEWSASPLAFIYQWEDCNSSGKECTAIPGAVNQAYYPVAGDEGHTLVAKAVALNAVGTTAATSPATSTVASGTPNTPLPEPPYVGNNAVTTLEYQVGVSSSSGPYEMSSTETATWGQSDDPSEAMAMAIFPPDKVMGWPAKKWEREIVYYLDGKDRTVNVANASGGISTTEYNKYNDVTRILSANNRKKALEETGKTAEASEKLDTENSYEEKGSEPGVELLSTLGPQHTVKLAVGKEKHNEEVLARDHTQYFYNEGKPAEGGPYHLVTKTIDGAETTSKEEFDQRTTEMAYNGQSGLGWKLRKPTSVIVDPSGLDIVHTTEYDPASGNITKTTMPAGNGKDATVAPTYKTSFGSKGAGTGQFNNPNDATTDAYHDVWVTDYTNNRVEEFTSAGAFMRAIGFGVTNGEAKFEICTTGCKAGIAGAGEGQFSGPAGVTFHAGGIYVTDYNNNRVEEFNENGEYIAQFGSKGTGTGQMKGPVSIVISSAGKAWIGDLGNNRVDEFTTAGVFTETIGFGVSNGEAKFEICTVSCKAGIAGSGNGQFSSVQGITISGTSLYVADLSNNRIEEFNEKGEYVTKFGAKGKGNGEFESPTGIASSSVTGNIYVTDFNNDRVQEFSAAGTYITQFGIQGTGHGQFSGPEGITVNASQDVYVVDTGNSRVEEWVPTITGNEGAHSTKTIYYSKEPNSEYSTCGNHPELANLPCETTPVAQPGTSGLPSLPVSEYTYNIWDEPLVTTETVGTTKRTSTNTYDGAGRLETATTSSTEGKELLPIAYEYNSTTGALEKQSTIKEGKAVKTITSIQNKLGELESYTDAGGTKTTYEYDIDGRPKKINDEKGIETFTYTGTSGLPTELVNEYGTAKLTFTATYNIEGALATEGYPNGMTATYGYNAVGKPTSLEYQKTTHCVEEAEKCKWFKDTVTPSIHGQWVEQTSTLSHQAYTYDKLGRLTEVQNTPTGKGCTVRIYSYDEDTNRTSLTTREPGTEGKCATTGGSTEGHTYDTADRLTDTGVAYNTFGDITTLPAQNTEDPELTSTYYTDSQVASQTQSKQTINYTLDAAGRTLETIATGEPNNSTLTAHYAGPGDTPAWSTNALGSEWSRNIPGIDGRLAAIQSNGETPELQLTNLHGDIIAKAYLSETATELAAKTDTSEYGVPTINLPAKYSWLGAIQLPTELPSGVINMGSRSYIPQIGRFLQPDPIPGGSANAYAYTFGDPVNTNDPSGAYSNTVSKTTEVELELQGQGITSQGQGIHEREEREAQERYAAEQAERAAAEAAAAAAAAAGPQYVGEEEYWEEWGEWWEEEGYEYASYRQREREAIFGPSVGISVVDAAEPQIEDAVIESGNGQEGSGTEPRLEGQCEVNSQSSGVLDVVSGGQREYVHGAQCPRLGRRSYYRGAERAHSSWWEPYARACIVGGAVGTVVSGQPELGCGAGVVGAGVEATADWVGRHT